MDKDLEIIFRDLEEEGLMNVLWAKKMPRKVRLVRNLKSDVDKVSISGESSKFVVKHSSAPKGILSVASSKMYRDAGIYTPQVHLIRTEDKMVVNTIQQDVLDINGLETIMPSEDLEYMQIDKKFYTKFKWQVFYDRGLENLFLQFMTPECLEQLKNIFLADEMRTDVDRHVKNYFLVKRKGSDKYEAIIVIDLDQMIIYQYCGTKKEEFESFLLYPYDSATPQIVEDRGCYRNRVNDIREMIQDGVLNDGNIKVIKSVLETDFPGEVKKVCKKQKLPRKQINGAVTPLERLWEYNRQTIGKELGM